MTPNPLASQCTARAKSNDMQRCQRRVIGGGVCWVHGGNAPQTRAAREARIIAMTAQLAAGEREPTPPRDPGQVLLSSIDLSDKVMLQLWQDFQRGEVSPELGRALGEWADRSGRLAKLALDSNAAERLVQVAERVSQAQANRLIAAMDRLLADPRVQVSGDARAVVLDALRGLDGESPEPRLRALPSD